MWYLADSCLVRLLSPTKSHYVSASRMRPRLPKSLLTLTVVIVLMVGFFSGIGRVSAQGAQISGNPATIIAFDTTLDQRTDFEAASFAANLIADSVYEGQIFVGTYGDAVGNLEPIASSDEAKSRVADIVSELTTGTDGDGVAVDLLGMLDSYGARLAEIGTRDANRMFILSAGGFDDVDPGAAYAVASDFAGDFRIDTVSLATTTAPDRDVLSALTDATGGISYDLGFADGVVDFVSNMLNTQLETTFDGASPETGGIDTGVQVLPHSSYMIVAFATEDDETESVIVSTNGQEISESVGSVSAFGLPGIKIFAVRNPQPGQWGARSRGGTENVKISRAVVNSLRIDFTGPPPFRVGEPVALNVDTRSGSAIHVDADAVIEAVVVDAEGVESTYALNDAGMDGDVTALDGTFTVTLPSSETEGVFEIRFTMRWSGIAPTIETVGSYRVAQFPRIDLVVSDLADPVGKSERTQIGTINVLRGADPYLVNPDDLEIALNSAADGVLHGFEAEAVELIDGKGYSFAIFAEFEVSGDFELAASVNSDFEGRSFESTAAAQALTIEVARPLPFVTIVAAFLLGTAAFGAIGFAAYAVVRPKPFGYLYRIDASDPSAERELVADFAAYRPSPLDWAINRALVPAAALPAVPLLGGSFVFTSDGTGFKYDPVQDGELRMLLHDEALRAGFNPIVPGETISIGGASYVFQANQHRGEVRVAERLRRQQSRQHQELQDFAMDPMTWDAPSSARPTRRH